MRIKISKYYTFILFFIITTVVCAQNPSKLYNKGMKAFYAEDFQEAEEYFEQIESTGRPFKDSKYRLEISKLVQRRYRESSLETIMEFREFKIKNDKFYHYWMGRIYANRYMFPEALDSWEKFLALKAFKSEEITSETEKFIKKAELMVSYFDYTDDFEIHRLESPVNSEYAELTPAYFSDSDELIFASNRSSQGGEDFSIFHAINEGGSWENTTPIPAFGKFERSNANVEVVNEDGRLFIFKDEKGGDLFFSEKSESGWNPPTKFDSKLSSAKLESHFYINEHEDRIIFATSVKKNGLDLMESFLDPESGKWGVPQPIGGTINSEFNEDSPFLSKDEKKLYFCSNRPGGVGGIDVYVSEFDASTKTWSKPENLGWPINSPDDEFHFKMNPDEMSGYFSSNRIHSMGDFDIFYFWEIEKTSIEGKIINALTNQPITSGEIRFLPSQYTDEYFRSKIDSMGRYSTQIIDDEIFEVKIVQEIDTIHQEDFEIHDLNEKNVKHFKDFYVYPYDIPQSTKDSIENALALREKQMQAVSKSETPTSSPEIASTKPVQNSTNQASDKIRQEPKPAELEVHSDRSIVLRNIYFEFGTSTLTSASDPMLGQLKTYMDSNPQSKLEVSGHTDNVGPKQVNMILSKKRAESIKNWLIENGASESRIITKGYGETRPLASNDDEKDGRALNRRIELRAIK